MSTLSVLYIVRNEEALLERSMRSVEAIADEFVVVDVASCDKTLQICRRFRNAKIFSHNWVHDYSKTRNFGLKHCSKNWVLYLDGDEMLDESAAASIKAAISHAAPNVWGFGLHIVDHEGEWGPMAQRNEKPFFRSPQTRVFRRSPDVIFKGRVNESIDETLAGKGATNIINAEIHHFLWRGKGASYQVLKLRYYNKLGGRYQVPADSIAAAELIQEKSAPPPPVDKVGICILAHNALNATKRCLQSVSAHTDVPYELFLVDNGSTDGTQAFMRSATGREPMVAPKNTGVAAGKNSAAQAMLRDPSIKYMCFLDNDTVVYPGWLSEMIGVMESHGDAAIVAPLTSNGSAPQKVLDQYPGKNMTEIAQLVHDRTPRSIPVKEVDGFCMLVKGSAIGAVGLFDDSFGVYGYEDKDFCRRIKNEKMGIYISNKTFVEHQGGASIRMVSKDWNRIMSESGRRYARKWDDNSVYPVSPLAQSRSKLEAKTSSLATNPFISIVIIAHNRLDRTRACIESVLDHSSNCEIIFVDNASTDGTLGYIARHPNIRVIKNDKNLGVPKARNQGIRASKGQFIVLMDNDIVVSHGWLRELYGKIHNGADIAGIEAWQLDKNFAASLKCVDLSQNFSYLGGACCMFRRKVFETVGLLDEGFSPAYYEDVDVCIRAKEKGMMLSWYLTSKIKHNEHSTLVHSQKDFNYQEQLGKSYVRFVKKMKNEIQVEHEILPPRNNKMKILYLGMEWDYGHRERGLSFEHDNFFPSLRDWDKTSELRHFDFVELGKVHGIPKMSDMLMRTVEEFQPDAMFSVFFNPQCDPRHSTVKYISDKTPTTTIGWFCDSHWRYDDFDKPWADNLNYSVTTSASAFERYKKDNMGNKIIKSQWAVSPKYKRIEGAIQDINVSFVGQPHGDRRQVIDKLRNMGVNVQVYGTGWGKRLTFDEMVSVYNRSKINLNLNNASDARFKQIKGRNFEVPGIGGFLMTELAENLADYYEPGKEIGVYSSVDELPDKIRHYLTFEEERKAIANAAYQRSMNEHTYAHRYNDIFSAAGLI